ncbi:MAG: ATP-binding cassette domain-containing protein [Candidatus Nealsonbacteria bacterium]|nr:ATP-binding cassette domain-containing protein [Candidatus Nealsonbacteria bacterium]
MIEARNIVKVFRQGEISFEALKGINLLIKEGSFVIITGRSGAGKSTLLYQLGLLDEPTSGKVIFDDYDTSLFSNNAKTSFRLSNIGYVFQDYALLPELTALENTVLPLMMMGVGKKESERRAKQILSRLGLEKKFNNLPSQLSGGEQQRVSISRAVVNDPRVVFADEPTANLDSKNAKDVVEVFNSLYKKGQTIVMVTHEKGFFNHADRIITLSDGKVEGISS